MKRILCFLLIPLTLGMILSSCGGSVRYWETISWDGEYDVIVVGFGGAGAVASITAADAGAGVLLTEKAPQGQHGGNTRVSAQFILDFTDYNQGLAYLKALRGDFYTTSDEELEYLVRGLMDNDEWLKKMGAKKLYDVAYPEYPELPGAQSVRFTMVDVDSITDNFNSKYWKLLERNVLSRNDKIDVWYSSPARHLIQDPINRTILGVKIEKDGQLLNIRAKNGVVLACGGFENNRLMIQNYNQRPLVMPIGTPYNEGDGVTMVLEVGADLWHMSATSGPFLSYFNLGNQEQGLFDMMLQNVLSNGFTGDPQGRRVVKSAFNVGPDGRRFTNEGVSSRHGFISYNGVFRPQLAVMPMYVIFDEAARKAGRIHPSFSDENQEEVRQGLIKSAGTIRELASLIGYRPEVLENTLNEFNASARAGKDPLFNRAANTMAPLGPGPFYALELFPGYVNTQGGARRNTNCEVLDPQGRPIPQLYSAGEFGSFFPDQYNAGGNLGETMVTGRTAGANAASPKKEDPPIKLNAVNSRIVYTLGSHPQEQPSYTLNAGEYLGTGEGMGGPLTVKIRLEGSRLVEVEILSHSETPGISDAAIRNIPQAILQAQSPNVEVVTGATLTSRGIMTAVEKAQASAR
ncbi:MAG: FAD-binding protein [Spirochaetales bacterium]|jgi:succinate dehydrogenase/fumarate reductase flavoprotein subunit|nr:FAD-binding protein [Spirochaetales bacterium]